MRKSSLLAVVATLVAAGALTSVVAPGATAETADGRVCPPLLSGKIDTTGDPDSVTVPAPAGMVITRYCVKAGSAKLDEGPVDVVLEEPRAEVVIVHPSGKAVSHYSYAWAAPGADTPSPSPSPTLPSPTLPSPTLPSPTLPSPTPDEPFDWDWEYPTPTCMALTVTYPDDLPAGQANDVNVRITTAGGERTLNFHNNDGTWSGLTSFVFADHPAMPDTPESARYEVVWVQVGGTNYHWQGRVACDRSTPDRRAALRPETPTGTGTSPVGPPSPGIPAAPEAPAAATLERWPSRTLRVERGEALAPRTVVVAGAPRVVLQKQRLRGWRSVARTAVTDETVVVRFPRESRAGVVRYRLVLPASGGGQRVISRPLVVEVR